ncbi:MAG: hypothetical protein IJV64_04650 [Oscillospiraceae bacterium]|nr:hypothetical protein [Oscillospiraceae bacterium]
MNKIGKFEITDMTFSGFKCYEEAMTAQFGTQTIITGGNGRGKSSVADAIAFAITGKPFFGEAGIDRLYTDGSKDLTVTLNFTDEGGAAHQLTRTRRNDRVTIICDGRELRQSDLTEMFGEKDVFLSIFNPLYFIEALGDDGRKLLERYLPSIPHETVLSMLSKSVQETLKNEEILSPDTYLKKRREEARELEETVIYLTGQKDLADTQKREARENADKLFHDIGNLEGEIKELEARRFDGADLSDVQERLADLSARYEEMAREAPEAADTSGIDAGLKELHQKLGERGAEQYAPKYAEAIAEITAKVKDVAVRYRRDEALLKGFTADTVCPMCRRAVTAKELPAVQAEIRKSVDALFAEGKELKGQLDELNALEKQTEATFRQFQADDVKTMQDGIAELEKQRESLIDAAAAQNERRKADMDEMLAQIRALSAETDCGSLSMEDFERLNACKAELESKNAEYAAAMLIVNGETQDFDAKIKAAEEKIAAKKKLIADVAQYVGKRTELLFSSLKMNRVEISLFDVVKSTGEVKDTFKFTYNGRRYDRLSLSEKIRAGMEVSELIKRLTGRNYPQFIDNMESVDDLRNVTPSGQVIMAMCVHGAELSIRPKQAQQMPKAA